MKPKSKKAKEQAVEREKRGKAKEYFKKIGSRTIIIGDIVSPIDVKWKAMED